MAIFRLAVQLIIYAITQGTLTNLDTADINILLIINAAKSKLIIIHTFLIRVVSYHSALLKFDRVVRNVEE